MRRPVGRLGRQFSVNLGAAVLASPDPGLTRDPVLEPVARPERAVIASPRPALVQPDYLRLPPGPTRRNPLEALDADSRRQGQRTVEFTAGVAQQLVINI